MKMTRKQYRKELVKHNQKIMNEIGDLFNFLLEKRVISYNSIEVGYKESFDAYIYMENINTLDDIVNYISFDCKYIIIASISCIDTSKEHSGSYIRNDSWDMHDLIRYFNVPTFWANQLENLFCQLKGSMKIK